MSNARAGSRAITAIPNPNRPTSRTTKTGAQPWMKRKIVAKISVTVVSIRGPYLEVHQLKGRASVRFPQNAADARMPCWLGERSRSTLMAGIINPIVDTIMKPDTEQNIQRPTGTQR